MNFKAVLWTCLTMSITLDVNDVVAFTTLPPMTLPPMTFPPPILPTRALTPGPFTIPPRPQPWTTPPGGGLGTQGVAAPFDLNPHRRATPPSRTVTQIIIECPYGFEQILTPCSSPEDGPPWPNCRTSTLKVSHRFAIDGPFQSCFDAVGTIKNHLGSDVPGNDTTSLGYPVATFEWLAFLDGSNVSSLHGDLEGALEEEIRGIWETRCSDFIELEVNCVLQEDALNGTVPSSPSSNECDEDYFFGRPDDFTPVWRNGSFLLFFNGTFIVPHWWSDRTIFDVVESPRYYESRQDITPELRVCGTPQSLINCAALLYEGDYVLKDNGNKTSITYNETEYNDEVFEYVSNNSIRICISHDNFSTVELIVGDEGAKTTNVQLIYSHVMFAISTLCIILLVITYLIFPELRNLQGCAILSFTVSLLISQVCLQYIAPYVYRPYQAVPLCQGVAVVGHCSLLCTFAWMTLLAFDLCRSFSGTQTRSPRSSSSRYKRYLKYSLFGWGVPLLLVAVSLSLHFTNNDILPLEYGSAQSKNCWVYPVLANIIFFIAPIVLSLAANLILFSSTVVNICRTTKATRSALQQNRTHKHAIVELLIYFKISCLLGFSWLFGLLAAGVRGNALWYLFLTVNALQGISVFLSFGVNARVRKMWRTKMGYSGTSSSGGSGSGKTKKTSAM